MCYTFISTYSTHSVIRRPTVMESLKEKQGPKLIIGKAYNYPHQTNRSSLQHHERPRKAIRQDI